MLLKTQVLFYFYFFIARQYAPSDHAHQDAGFVLFLFFYCAPVCTKWPCSSRRGFCFIFIFLLSASMTQVAMLLKTQVV
jgi:hypothetical protein